MLQVDKDRIRRFRRAYPELDEVEDVYILKMIDINKRIKKAIALSIKRRIAFLSRTG